MGVCGFAKVTTWLLVMVVVPLVARGQGLQQVPLSPYPLLAQAYTRADGLTSDYVNAVLQDRNGYLWFATDRGISRFDGTAFTPYTADNGLPGNMVYSLYEDAAGRMWAATYEGGLACQGRLGFQPFRARGPAAQALATTSALAGDSLGGVFALTASGLVAVAPDSTARYVLQSRSPAEKLSLAPLPNGCLAVRGTELFFYTRHDQPPVLLNNPLPDRDGLGSAPTWHIQPLGGYRVLLVGGNRSYQLLLRGDRLLLEKTYSFQGTCALWLGTQLYMGSRFHGLVVADSSRQLRYGTLQGLPVAYVTYLATDYEGGLWVATFGGGVLRLQPGSGRWLQAPQHLAGNKVSCLFRSQSGHLWVGTDGGYSVYYQGQCTVQRPLRKDPYFTLRAMAECPDGSLVMGTYTHLFWSPSTQAALAGDWRPIAEVGNGVSALVANADGSLWVGTYGSGLLQVALNPTGAYPDLPNVASMRAGWRITRWLSTQNGLAEDMVEALVPSPSGTWVLHAASPAGRLQGGAVQYLTQEHHLPSRTVNCVYEDPSGVVWLGTQKGLAYLSADSIRTLAATQLPPELVGRPIRGMFAAPAAAAPTAVAWVLTDQQLFSLEKNEAGYFVRRAGTWLHLPGAAPSVNRLWVDNQRLELAVGTSRGVLLYDLRALQQAAVPPRVRITEVLLDGAAVDPAGTAIELPATHQALTLRVAGLSFLGAVPIQYRYRLQGLEEAYGPPTAVPEATYRNLPDGTYTFQVLAINADGVPSAAPATLRFRVAPPLLKRTWFQLLIALGAMGSVAGVARYYARQQLLGRIRALEIQQRLDAERERISRDLHDNIGAQLTSILSGLEFSERLGAQQNPRLSDLVSALKQDARTTISQLRDTIWALRQPAISASAFLEQFGTFASRQLQYEESLRYEVHATGIEGITLRPAQALGLFRVLQEALQNTRKHAAASCITLTAERPALDCLSLTFHDNGKGLTLTDDDPHALANAGHYGLSNMALRLTELGGTFRVHAAPENGTTLVFTVPLTPNQPPGNG